MPELMGDDSCGKSERVTDLMQVIAELADESHFSCWTCQQPPIWRQRIEGAEEAEALDELCEEGVAGDHAFGLELSEGDMHSALIWTGGTQAIEGQVRALSDAHAGASE